MTAYTPTMLQDELVTLLKTELSKYPLKNARNQLMGVNVYAQYLPIKEDEKDSAHFPFIVVDLVDITADTSRVVKIGFYAGVYDPSQERQGYKDVLNILERAYQILATKYAVGGFSIIGDIKTTLMDEEDFYPYYFGVMETNWEGAIITMDDSLL